MKIRKLGVAFLFFAIAIYARTIYVASNGDDGNGSGGSSSPYATLGKGVAQCVGGDTVFIRAGSYNEGGIVVDASRSGTSDHPTVIMGEGRDQVVFDAGWSQDFFLKICGTDYIVVKNISIRRYRPWNGNRGALQINTDCGSTSDTCHGCVLEDIQVDSSGACGVVMRICSNITLRRVETRFNFQNGFVAIDNDGIQVISCRAFKNNPGYPEVPWIKYYPDRSDKETILGNGVDKYGIAQLDPKDSLYRTVSVWSAGGWKALGVSNVEVDDFEGSENYGPGMWYDTDNHNITIRNSRFNGNRPIYHQQWNVWLGGIGVMMESNADLNALMENCLARDNLSENCQLAESKGITIRNCYLYGRIFLREDALGTRPVISDLIIEDNVLVNCWLTGWYTNAYWNADTIAIRNIVFRGNRWEGSEPYFSFNDWHNNGFQLRVEGLDNMKAAWNTFLTDTYSSTVTSANMSPACQTSGRRRYGDGDMTPVFDLRGRLIGYLNVAADVRFVRPQVALSLSQGRYVSGDGEVVLRMSR